MYVYIWTADLTFLKSTLGVNLCHPVKILENHLAICECVVTFYMKSWVLIQKMIPYKLSLIGLFTKDLNKGTIFAKR